MKISQLTTVQRNALTPTLTGSCINFNPTTAEYEGFNAGIWASFLTSTANHGRVLYVSKNGNDGFGLVGRVDRPFLTIQAAINASLTGDTILVFAGTYTENILIDTKRLDIFCIGRVIINGDIVYQSTSLSFAIYVFEGKATIINGNITFIMSTNSILKVDVLQVNKVGGTAFIIGGLNRAKFIVNNATVVANFLTTGQDTQGLYSNFHEFTNVVFTGVSITNTSSITTTGIFSKCRFNISSHLALNRTDFTTEIDFICSHYIDCIINRTGASTVDLFLFNFGGLGVVKMERCFVKGTFALLQQGLAGSVNRSSGIYLYDCNFREATFSAGALFNVIDPSNITQWKVFIDKTVLRPSTIVYQASSLAPSIPANQYINFVNY